MKRELVLSLVLGLAVSAGAAVSIAGAAPEIPAVNGPARPAAEPPRLAQEPDVAAARCPGAIAERFDGLPLLFIENRGQVDSGEVAYYIKGRDRTLYFTAEGITIDLAGTPKAAQERWALKLGFENARKAQPEAAAKQPATFSYFRGKPGNWKSGLASYRQLVYRDLWPGIDLELRGDVNHLKYQFLVRPGADPRDIQIACDGAERVIVDASGRLNIATPAGTVTDERPAAWQAVPGKNRRVAAEYAVQTVPAEAGSAAARGFAYGFSVGTYDRDLPLVIDPDMIMYCGYIGGDADDFGYAVAADKSGCAYVAGQTSSSEFSFPVAAGPGLIQNGACDAFVAKLNPQGTALIYCGYIGGDSTDWATGIAIDAAGRATISGTASSTEATFPVLVGPDLTYNGSSFDAFVAKINAAGTALMYCGYIGGSGWDRASSVAVDAAGDAYVAGYTASSAATFPVAVGPDLVYNGGTQDAFVAKVAASGSALLYCGYIGGNDYDLASGIAVDTAGAAYVAGYTESGQATFPATVGPDLTFNGGITDAFIAKVDPSGTGLAYCGYIGGNDWDGLYAVAVHPTGYAFVTGWTHSTEATFPVAVGPDLTFNGSATDAFVAKIEPSGAALTYCGYIGGSGDESARAIAVDPLGGAYVAGQTTSLEFDFPVLGGPDLTFNGVEDAFVAKVVPSGASLGYCGYIGGLDADRGYGIAVGPCASVFVTGYTASNESTFPAAVGPDVTFNFGGYDAFVAMVREIVPDVTANGSDGPLAIPKGTNLQIDVALDPGSLAGRTADWWILAHTPGGWYYYRLAPQGWVPGMAPSRQGSLLPVPSRKVFSWSGLPAGSYTFVFGVDLNVDGFFNVSAAAYDSVLVNVQ